MGVDLRFGGGGESDGDLVSLMVSPVVEQRGCDGVPKGCVEREVDGGTLVVAWEEVAPEEDPGYVSVGLVRDDGHVVFAGYSGPAIEGDPREADLPIPVSLLEELVQDPRVGITTDQAVIDADEKVTDWEGGEAADTTDPSPAPVSPESLKGFYLTYSGLSGFSGTGDSRELRPFGPDAVGIEISLDSEDVRYRVVDVIASPQAPTWLAADPCATRGFSCTSYDAALGQVHLLWRAGRTGEVWLLNVRPDEVVAFGLSSWKVPEQERAVAASIDLDTLRAMLDDDVHVGMTSTAGLERVRF